MIPSRVASATVLALVLLLEACASRPINPPIGQVEPTTGYRFQTRQKYLRDSENLVVLAFSGGGTRAAAFSYGVLEFLRRTEIVGPKGSRIRLLDEVDVITGVSGGSFTALAYGLYVSSPDFNRLLKGCGSHGRPRANRRRARSGACGGNGNERQPNRPVM